MRILSLLLVCAFACGDSTPADPAPVPAAQKPEAKPEPEPQPEPIPEPELKPEPEPKPAAPSVSEQLAATKPAWLYPADACPADVMPAKAAEVAYDETRCQGDKTLECMKRCKQGAAVACYEAALVFQPDKVLAGLGEALFLKSCELGYASGCTNRAAGLRLKIGDALAEGDHDACAARTFERMCLVFNDSWACTMMGSTILMSGEASARREEMLKVLAIPCVNDPQDPACLEATRLRDMFMADPASFAKPAG